MATGRYAEWGSRFSRQISIEPASPAPKTMTFTVAAADRRARWRTANSMYRAPSIASKANMVLPATAWSAACWPADQPGTDQCQEERHHAGGHADAHDLVQAAPLVPAAVEPGEQARAQPTGGRSAAMSLTSVNGVNGVPARSRVIQAAASSPQIQEARHKQIRMPPGAIADRKGLAAD